MKYFCSDIRSTCIDHLNVTFKNDQNIIIIIIIIKIIIIIIIFVIYNAPYTIITKLTLVKLAPYSHSAVDSPKKVQKHPQKVSVQPARQPTSQKPVFSTFKALLIIFDQFFTYSHGQFSVDTFICYYILSINPSSLYCL